MKCNHCGNEVPEGSIFCNHCGQRIITYDTCPHCHAQIPTGSAFCTKCGKQINAFEFDEEPEPLNEPERQPEPQPSPQHEQTAHYGAASRQPVGDPWEQRRAQEQNTPKYRDDDNDEDDEENESNEPSHYNRNLIIGAVAVAAIIGLLLMVRSCSSSDYKQEAATADSIALVNSNNQDPVALLNSELSRNNFTNDNAVTAGAVRIPASGDKPARILGITALSDPNDQSFYKIYKLTQNGNSWNTELMHTQHLNGRSITMDHNSMIADIQDVPRAVRIGDNDYFYYAYLNLPNGSNTNGRVSLCLFDIDTKKLITVDYDGQFRTRDDGRNYIYGKPLQAINSPETKFLDSEAKKIKIIYFQTEEEIKAEEEAKAKAEEEERLADPDNAEQRWNEENSENVESLKKGDEVTLKRATYDKPIFASGDVAKRIQNADYLVISVNNGAVYGFDKATRKYFTIYSPKTPASQPSEIGFQNSASGIIGMRTPDGHYTYDLNSGKTKKLPD